MQGWGSLVKISKEAEWWRGPEIVQSGPEGGACGLVRVGLKTKNPEKILCSSLPSRRVGPPQNVLLLNLATKFKIAPVVAMLKSHKA